MTPASGTGTLDARVRAAWQTQLAAAVKTPGLLPQLVHQRQALLPRFATAYAQVRALPRRLRRQLQRRWKQSLAGLALLLALGAAPALAATITVNITTPDVNNDGFCSLIEALDNANDTADGNVHDDCTAGDPTGADTIELPASTTHTLTTINNSIYGPTGLPVITSEITLEGHGSTIKREPTDADVFRLVAVNADGKLTLKDTTLSGGEASGSFPANVGGGILNFGTVELLNSTLTGNSAGFGGGVLNFAYYGTVTVTITDSTLSGNSAAYGGGVVNYAGNPAGSSGASTVTITNSTLSGNSAINGGGVFNFAITSSGASTVTLTNSTLSGNSAAAYGGGVFNFAIASGASTVTLTNSTLSGNSAAYGGGVFNFAIASGASTVTLSRSLVSGNTAAPGAEVYNASSTVTAANANLFGHSAVTDAQAFVGFTPSGSDLTATSDCTPGPTCIPTALTDILNTTLADNGGPTKTHALVAGSPALDASPDDDDCEDTDQRGVTRPQGVACDIGAFESEDVDLLCPGLEPTDGCTVNGVPHQLCVGTAGNDVITGTKGVDVLLGLGGNDTLLGKKGDDVLCGGAGKDLLKGGPGNDLLLGASGDDTLKSDKGNDHLEGGTGTDALNGGKGSDECVAGEILKNCEMISF